MTKYLLFTSDPKTTSINEQGLVYQESDPAPKYPSLEIKSGGLFGLIENQGTGCAKSKSPERLLQGFSPYVLQCPHLRYLNWQLIIYELQLWRSSITQTDLVSGCLQDVGLSAWGLRRL